MLPDASLLIWKDCDVNVAGSIGSENLAPIKPLMGNPSVLSGGYTAITRGAVVSVGASTYLFLFVRAEHQPFINEADPSTWQALRDVIRREQYPVRSPFDNPMQFHGPENTGRSLHMVWWQIVNYLQYYDWQWSNGLALNRPVFAPLRFPFTVLFTTLGIFGSRVLYRRDRSVFWLLFVLFVTTGPALVAYISALRP